jgi:hypothetical protein
MVSGVCTRAREWGREWVYLAVDVVGRSIGVGQALEVLLQLRGAHIAIVQRLGHLRYVASCLATPQKAKIFMINNITTKFIKFSFILYVLL